MKKIVWVCDTLGWCQERRGRDLAEFIPEYEWEILDNILPFWDDHDAIIVPWRWAKSRTKRLRCLGFERYVATVGGHYELGPHPTCFKKGSDPQRESAKALDVLSRFRMVLVNSELLYKMLAPELSTTEVRYCPNGVDTETFSFCTATYSQGAYSFGWRGRNKAAKNVGLLYIVEDRLKGAHQVSCNFHIIEKSEAVPLPLGGKIQYEGWDFVLNVSWHEGMSNSMLEAASCGCIPITTPVGDHPKLVRHGETGFIVEPTVESVTETIRKAASMTTEEYEAMSRRVRDEVVRNWSWSVRAQAYRNALEEVLR